MKKAVAIFVLLVVLTLAFTSVAFAAGHNIPAIAEKHGLEVTGAEWGELVSDIATSEPAAIPNAHGWLP